MPTLNLDAEIQRFADRHPRKNQLLENFKHGHFIAAIQSAHKIYDDFIREIDQQQAEASFTFYLFSSKSRESLNQLRQRALVLKEELNPLNSSQAAKLYTVTILSHPGVIVLACCLLAAAIAAFTLLSPIMGVNYGIAAISLFAIHNEANKAAQVMPSLSPIMA